MFGEGLVVVQMELLPSRCRRCSSQSPYPPFTVGCDEIPYGAYLA
jgi:hypothetical protein